MKVSIRCTGNKMMKNGLKRAIVGSGGAVFGGKRKEQVVIMKVAVLGGE